MSDLIKIACYRTGPDWPETTSADLATAIVQPAAIKSLRLTAAFQAAVAGGADLSELGAVYRVMTGEFITNLRDALHEGDLSQVQTLVAIAGADSVLAWSQATKDALDAVISANRLRLIDVVAAEIGEDAPESVSAADVDAALGRN
jgi:hypothetical protein